MTCPPGKHGRTGIICSSRRGTIRMLIPIPPGPGHRPPGLFGVIRARHLMDGSRQVLGARPTPTKSPLNVVDDGIAPPSLGALHSPPVCWIFAAAAGMLAQIAMRGNFTLDGSAFTTRNRPRSSFRRTISSLPFSFSQTSQGCETLLEEECFVTLLEL